MIALTSSDIQPLLSPSEIIALVESAARAVGDRGCVVPQRQQVHWAGNTLLVMPAVGGGALAVKLVSVVPPNAARALPVTNGLLVLSDAGTGLPLAIMAAESVTALRTGAVGALGLAHTTPADVDSIGIIGTGVQGTWQAIFACAVRPVRQIFALRRSPAGFERFVATLAEHVPAVDVIPCADAAEVLARTPVIITATTAAEPVLPDEPALLAGKHFIAIGSYKPAMRELPDSALRLAGHLVLDSDFARHEAGEAVRAVAQRILADEQLFPIAELLSGRRAIEVGGTTAYKSAGMALYDLCVAWALFEAARRRQLGQEIRL